MTITEDKIERLLNTLESIDSTLKRIEQNTKPISLKELRDSTKNATVAAITAYAPKIRN